MTDAVIPLALEIRNPATGDQLFAVAETGQVFWNGREIIGDDDFRQSFTKFGDYVAGVAHGDIRRILATLTVEQRLELRNMISETGALVEE